MMKKGKEPLGAIPTPIPIVRLMVNLAFEYLKYSSSSTVNSGEISVIDNSVGDGRFLFEIMKYWQNLKKVDRKNCNLILHGLDINNKSINECESNKSRLSIKKDVEISFKTGNALIGYVKPINKLKRKLTKIKINNSFFDDLKINQPSTSLRETAFHWFHEWPIPNTKEGYDLCIGNPPFGISFSIEEKDMFKRIYEGVDPEIESYLLFVERSVHLLREGGVIVFLIPNNFTTNFRYQIFREYILKTLHLKKIIMLEDNIFPQVSVETCILVGYKKIKDDVNSTNSIEFSKFSIGSGFSLIQKNEQLSIMSQKFKYIMPDMTTETAKILKIMEKNSFPLNDIAYISRGIELGFNSKFTSNIPTTKKFVPLIAGRNIQKYTIKEEKRYIEFDSNQKSIFKDKSMYTKPKVLLRRIGNKLIAVYDPNNLFCVCDVYMITFQSQWSHFQLEHLEIILNSSLFSFYLNHKFKTVKKIFPKIPIDYLKQLPIKLPFSAKEEEILEKLRKKKGIMKGDIETQLDEIIYNYYKISKSQKQIIETSLSLL